MFVAGLARRELVQTEDDLHLYDRAAPLLTDLCTAGAEISARNGKMRGHLRVSVPSLLARFGLANGLPLLERVDQFDG